MTLAGISPNRRGLLRWLHLVGAEAKHDSPADHAIGAAARHFARMLGG